MRRQGAGDGDALLFATRQLVREAISLVGESDEFVAKKVAAVQAAKMTPIVCVGETDKEAQERSQEGIWYFLRNCLKGHQRREGRQLTYGPGVPYIPPSEWRGFLENTDPTTPLLGDMKPIVSVKELMDDMIDPAGDYIFDSVKTLVRESGT